MMKTIADSASDAALVRPLRLAPGQALHLPVRPGTGLQVTAGALRVRTPMRWLADAARAQPFQCLGEGEGLCLEDGGWLALEAAAGDSEARLLLVEPAQPLLWLWRRLRALALWVSRAGTGGRQRA